MAMIVRHKPTGAHYVLLGTGFGAYSSRNSSFLGGDLFPDEDYGEVRTAALSDAQGNILWLPTEELQVLEVDGRSVEQLLGSVKLRADRDGVFRLSEAMHGRDEGVELDVCPGCGHQVKSTAPECPSCGLTLISTAMEPDETEGGTESR
ncbi:zinc ribbon domain-containing protein [Paenibacillus koleovorans]|uniref:zinc ribbon domain-containing protein n=1 Tax=Paenibacillus koleovorans TaxID=121608 RepID=UPI000FD73F1F|nr:zinc ribbon domain-containing protein [Paenibacillus koleovorans]